MVTSPTDDGRTKSTAAEPHLATLRAFYDKRTEGLCMDYCALPRKRGYRSEADRLVDIRQRASKAAATNAYTQIAPGLWDDISFLLGIIDRVMARRNEARQLADALADALLLLANDEQLQVVKNVLVSYRQARAEGGW